MPSCKADLDFNTLPDKFLLYVKPMVEFHGCYHSLEVLYNYGLAEGGLSVEMFNDRYLAVAIVME
jgi:hypothetical protein